MNGRVKDAAGFPRGTDVPEVPEAGVGVLNGIVILLVVVSHSTMPEYEEMIGLFALFYMWSVLVFYTATVSFRVAVFYRSMVSSRITAYSSAVPALYPACRRDVDVV